jgi:hypothetical protein
LTRRASFLDLASAGQEGHFKSAAGQDILNRRSFERVVYNLLRWQAGNRIQLNEVKTEENVFFSFKEEKEGNIFILA